MQLAAIQGCATGGGIPRMGQSEDEQSQGVRMSSVRDANSTRQRQLSEIWSLRTATAMCKSPSYRLSARYLPKSYVVY